MLLYLHQHSCIVHRLLLLFFFTCFIDADTSDYYVGGDTGAIETGLCSVYRWMTCYCVVVSLQEAVAIDRLEKHIKKSNQQLDRAEQTALSLKYPHLEQDRDWVSEGVERQLFWLLHTPPTHVRKPLYMYVFVTWCVHIDITLYVLFLSACDDYWQTFPAKAAALFQYYQITPKPAVGFNSVLPLCMYKPHTLDPHLVGSLVSMR